jgi:hypothetical protein
MRIKTIPTLSVPAPLHQMKGKIMKVPLRNLALLVFLVASAAHCDYWFRIPLSVFSRVEYSTASKIILTAPDGLVHPIQKSTNGTFTGTDINNPNKDQIEINIPSGIDPKAWLSMVLTAVSTGGRIQFNADESNSVVTNVNSNTKIFMILP